MPARRASPHAGGLIVLTPGALSPLLHSTCATWCSPHPRHASDCGSVRPALRRYIREGTAHGQAVAWVPRRVITTGRVVTPMVIMYRDLTRYWVIGVERRLSAEPMRGIKPLSRGTRATLILARPLGYTLLCTRYDRFFALKVLRWQMISTTTCAACNIRQLPFLITGVNLKLMFPLYSSYDVSSPCSIITS